MPCHAVRLSCASFSCGSSAHFTTHRSTAIYAVAACLPLGFFLPTSEMVRPANATLVSSRLNVRVCVRDGGCAWEWRTWGKALLELLGLVGVLEDKCVDVLRAADLELDVVDLLVLLYAGGCDTVSSSSRFRFKIPSAALSPLLKTPHRHLLSPSSAPAGNARRRTLGILAPADLDELLDVGDFGRHFDGVWLRSGGIERTRSGIVNFEHPAKLLWSGNSLGARTTKVHRKLYRISRGGASSMPVAQCFQCSYNLWPPRRISTALHY